jgi:nicotinamidase-related amidase
MSTSTNIAVLLVDSQRDFLSADAFGMPVDSDGAEKVIESANAIFAKRTLGNAVPVLVVNKCPASARIANFFRRGAAVSGSPDTQIDPRVENASQVKIIRIPVRVLFPTRNWKTFCGRPLSRNYW